MSQYSEEIERRRTFAIISHPDAGKTTLTEKLLLFGEAIHLAAAVKSNKIKKTATSDWMEIEKQRGISVATSVMAFDYSGHKINILDINQTTVSHQLRFLKNIGIVKCSRFGKVIFYSLKNDTVNDVLLKGVEFLGY